MRASGESRGKKIVIYSEYVDNNGDLTFGCKMAAKIRAQYPDADIQVVTIPKVTPWGNGRVENNKGMALERTNKLRDFNKDIPFPVQHLDDYTSTSSRLPDMIIVGPVVMPGCKHTVEYLAGRNNQSVNVLLISEYGFKQEHLEATKIELEKLKFKNVSLQTTGVTENKGIFFDREIAGFDRTNESHVNDASKKIGNVGVYLHATGSLLDYLQSHDVAMHYSHNNAERVVGVHANYVEANRDTDLIVLGENNKNDRTSLIANIDRLKENGFAKIVYVDCPKDPEVLFDSGDDGPTYRIIHTGRVSLEQSIALRKISGEFSGATGDQSYSEALSRSPIVIYETQPWKKDFLEDQVKLAAQIDPSGQLPRAVLLMGSAKTEVEYVELAHLLKEPAIKAGLLQYRELVSQDHDLQSKLDKTFRAVHNSDVGQSQKSGGISVLEKLLPAWCRKASPEEKQADVKKDPQTPKFK